MNIVSLFDGMSCGQIALMLLGIKIDKYYASEIDKYAIAQTQLNFPDTIQLGDVTKWKDWNIDWSTIDLVIGGSPCQGFSMSGKMLAFDDERSKLFFEFHAIVEHCKLHNPNMKFLLENVVMKQEHNNVITDYMGVLPNKINSSIFSAQSRPRIYWTNIKLDKLPNECSLVTKDILEDNVNEKYDLSYTMSRNKIIYDKVKGNGIIGHCGSGNQHGVVYSIDYKMGTLCATDYKQPKQIWIDNKIRKLTPTEYARLQTIPDTYIWKSSNTQIYKMLGNGWNIETIKFLFKNLLK